MMSLWDLKLLVVLALTIHTTSAGLRRAHNGGALDTNDFVNGEEIDIENEIPEDQDPLNDAIESGNEFEGDIRLTSQQEKVLDRDSEIDMRSALQTGHWPRTGGYVRIPYTIDHSEFDENERANIARAIIEFEENTCIRVIPRTTETDYVSIFRGSGCWSYLGKVGGKQKLSLKKGCAWSVGTPIHELMHAIGYKHEQSRSDRDNFVEIKWDNIKDGKEGNFRKCTSCDLQGLPYDIGSIMHYHARAFAKDPSKPTIVPLNGVGIRNIGQRNGFSDSDIEGINKLYCNDIISVCSNDLPCLNGGTCVDGSCSCPSGITGTRCEIA